MTTTQNVRTKLARMVNGDCWDFGEKGRNVMVTRVSIDRWVVAHVVGGGKPNVANSPSTYRETVALVEMYNHF